MIVAIVASLSIVPAADALQNLKNKEFLTRAEVQLEMIISAAQTLAIEGPGGIQTIEIDFASDGSIKFERITIGDAKGGPNMSSVVLAFSNGGRMTKTALDPPVWMTSLSNRELTIASSTFTLRMTADLEGRNEFLLVEMV